MVYLMNQLLIFILVYKPNFEIAIIFSFNLTNIFNIKFIFYYLSKIKIYLFELKINLN